jgi:bifunctional non-homologous end joining protein LigD
MPTVLEPMMARPGSWPTNTADWAAELKWDGIRAVAFVDRGEVRIQGRRLNEISGSFPDLAVSPTESDRDQLILDGEIVALDSDGRPHFQGLQRRDDEFSRRFVAFDLLWRDGRDLRPLPYLQRREELASLSLRAPWMAPGHLTTGIDSALAYTAEQGLEGLVLKRLDSRYAAGVRSRDWLKIKNRMRQEFVVGGWIPGRAARSSSVGSLLLGYNDPEQPPEGALTYAGRVGSGFADSELAFLAGRLLEEEIDEPPFAPAELPAGARFLFPTLVVEVEFAEWTDDGHLRHPVFIGVRQDKHPSEVVRESAGSR